VLNQVVNRVVKGAGLELILVIDHDHDILVVVVVLEAGHADNSLSVCLILPKPKGISGFFYSLNAGVTGRFGELAENRSC
jgi:hypothetical protein